MALHLLRSKLKHIIVDEYQDMSVSQHALLRLVVRGVVEDDDILNKDGIMMMMMDGYNGMSRTRVEKNKAEQHHQRKLPILLDKNTSDCRYTLPKKLSARTRRKASSSRRSRASLQNYNVPILFCAGDASQSVYGWRGAAPSLTVDGFRRDYPQGIVAPFDTCYRLSSDILDAAAMLQPMDAGENDEIWSLWGNDSNPLSCDVSPAAAAKVASSVREFSAFHRIGVNVQSLDLEEGLHLGESILLSESTQDSSVLIHGLWDAREEAKYIASTIRRRSKQRRKSLTSALKTIGKDITLGSEKELLDLTDVAVMVRSSKQLDLVKEELKNAGIPFVVYEKKYSNMPNDEDDGTQSWLA